MPVGNVTICYRYRGNLHFKFVSKSMCWCCWTGNVNHGSLKPSFHTQTLENPHVCTECLIKVSESGGSRPLLSLLTSHSFLWRPGETSPGDISLPQPCRAQERRGGKERNRKIKGINSLNVKGHSFLSHSLHWIVRHYTQLKTTCMPTAITLLHKKLKVQGYNI